MKKCPYCAEQIQDEAILCRFCNREVPKAVTPPTTAPVAINTAGVAILITLGLLGAMVFAAKIHSDRQAPAKPNRILDVSGGRNALGLVLTNREAEPLTGCAISILERGRSDEWTAVIERLDPMQTAVVQWDRFIKAGARMPAYIGTSSRGATVDCQSHIGTRQGAGLHFQ